MPNPEGMASKIFHPRPCQFHHRGVEHHGICKKTKPFLSFAGGTVHLSALKPAENGDGTILRLYNPTAEHTEDTVIFSRTFRQIKETRMDEEPLSGGFVTKKGTSFTIRLPAFKVRTFRIFF